VRHAIFRYAPDANAGFAGVQPEVSWTFLNPRVGVTYALQPSTELFASVGRTTREPTRSDLFAGNDDVSRATLTDLGGLTRVGPERVTSTEAGVRWHARTVRVELNAFRMDVRNEIAQIGALSPLGTPLRSNVGASVREGIEFDVRWRPTPALVFTTVGAASHNRIKQFVDSTDGESIITRTNVPPLLTPAYTATQRIDWRAARWIDVGVEGRYQDRSFLRNDGNAALTLPSYTTVDAMVRFPIGTNDISIRGTNLTNSMKYGSGYAVDGVANYFILPPRSVYVTLRIATR
jgi:iron complex outermembrane receptor protein